MSCKVMSDTCDHCGKEVSPYINRQWKAGFLTVGSKIDDIHACSKEHLSLALAKVFDIPLDTSTLRLVTEKNDALNAARVAIVDRDNMRARVAELEPRIPANEVTNAERAQYEATIELQRKRIEELQANVDGLERDRRHCVEAISESNLVPPGRTLVEGIGELVRLQRHAVKKIVDNTSPSLDDLAKKLVPVFEQAYKDGPNNQLASVRVGIRAVLAALPMPFAEPVTVDGKTPGEVLILAQHGLRPFQVSREIVESAEHAAGAVLRAFGNSPSGQTTPPTVDGKTPGQVDYEAYSAARLGPDDHGSRWDHLDERTKQWNEAGAKAVLRAFGNQPGQTPPTSAVEVLRRARDFIGQCLEFTVIDGDVEFVTVAKKSVMLAISEELAKCGPAEPTVDDYVKAVAEAGTLESRRVKPASDHAHEIGSCSFCDKPPGTASITDPSKPTKPEES